MTDTRRCEPPDTSRDGSWHWLEHPHQGPIPVKWGAANRWWPQGAWGIVSGGHDPQFAHAKGYRYLMPVPSPAEIEALTTAAADIIAQWNAGRIQAVDSPDDSHGTGTMDNLDAALAPFFAAKETGNG